MCIVWPPSAQVPFRGSSADRAVGFAAAALFFAALLQFLLKPDSETFGPLLALAQTWLSSFCDLRGGVAQELREGKMGAVCVSASKASSGALEGRGARSFLAMS